AGTAQDLVALGLLHDLDDGDAERDALAILRVLPGKGVHHAVHLGPGRAFFLLENRVPAAVEYLGLEVRARCAANEGGAGEALVRLAGRLRMALRAVAVEERVLDHP